MPTLHGSGAQLPTHVHQPPEMLPDAPQPPTRAPCSTGEVAANVPPATTTPPSTSAGAPVHKARRGPKPLDRPPKCTYCRKKGLICGSECRKQLGAQPAPAAHDSSRYKVGNVLTSSLPNTVQHSDFRVVTFLSQKSPWPCIDNRRGSLSITLQKFRSPSSIAL